MRCLRSVRVTGVHGSSIAITDGDDDTPPAASLPPPPPPALPGAAPAAPAPAADEFRCPAGDDGEAKSDECNALLLEPPAEPDADAEPSKPPLPAVGEPGGDIACCDP